MAGPIVQTLVTLSLLATFGFLHLLHLVSHSIRLQISIIKKLADQLDQILVSSRLKKRDVRADLANLKKSPAHLAVCWIPINYQLHQLFSLKALSLARSNRLERLRFQQSLELKSIMENASKLLLWSMEAGTKEITFYDERGLLKSHKVEFIQYLERMPTFSRGNEHISSASIHSQPAEEVEILPKLEITYRLLPRSSKKTEKNLSASALAIKSLKVNLIDRTQGHEHLAKVTQALVQMNRLNNKEAKILLDDLSVKTIGEKICSTSIGLPDLLLVLGGRSLRFRGFPPWQLTLTEIYHAASYGIFPRKIQYREYLEAMNVFGDCQQRVGT